MGSLYWALYPFLPWYLLVAWVSYLGLPSLFYLDAIGVFPLDINQEGWMMKFHITSQGQAAQRLGYFVPWAFLL